MSTYSTGGVPPPDSVRNAKAYTKACGSVGARVGDADGIKVVGLVLGRNVDGLCDGLADGLPVGAVGRPVGAYDGGGM